MNKHTAVVAVVACVAMLVAAYVFLAGPENAQAPSGPVACTMDAKQCADGSYVGRTGPRCEFAPCPGEVATPGLPQQHVVWTFTPGGERDDIPYTQVSVQAGTKAYDVGSYAGSCNELVASGLAQGEVSGALCWYAGGGVEFGVFTVGARPTLRAREVDEGSAEVPATPGAWHDLLELK